MIGRMKYWMLISAGLRRKPVRTFLTGFAVVVSFLLFGVMHGVLAGFDDALDTLSETRLRVINRASMIAALPVAHGARIENIEGVRDVSHMAIFGGYYQDPTNRFSIAAVEMDSFFRVVEELTVPDEQFDKLLRSRTGAVVLRRRSALVSAVSSRLVAATEIISPRVAVQGGMSQDRSSARTPSR